MTALEQLAVLAGINPEMHKIESRTVRGWHELPEGGA